MTTRSANHGDARSLLDLLDGNSVELGLAQRLRLALRLQHRSAKTDNEDCVACSFIIPLHPHPLHALHTPSHSFMPGSPQAQQPRSQAAPTIASSSSSLINNGKQWRKWRNIGESESKSGVFSIWTLRLSHLIQPVSPKSTRVPKKKAASSLEINLACHLLRRLALDNTLTPLGKAVIRSPLLLACLLDSAE